PRLLVLVHGLGVEPALDPGRQGASAVRVERDVGDRPRLRGVAGGDECPVVPGQLVGGRTEVDTRQELGLRADLPGGAADRGRRTRGRGRIEAVTGAEAVLVGWEDLDVERRD